MKELPSSLKALKIHFKLYADLNKQHESPQVRQWFYLFLDEFSLVPLLVKQRNLDFLEAFTLEIPEKFQHNVITSFLKDGKSSSSEEDHGMAKPIALAAELNLVHKGIDSSFVILRAGNLLGTKNGIASFVVSIEHPVGEASHTDPDTLKHTIASELVHDERRFNISRLLVGVGHKTTHKVGLARVKGLHQAVEGDKVDRGHSLAATTLLLLLAFLLWRGCRLARMVKPQVNKQGRGTCALEYLNNRVIDRILVLLKPVGHIVRHNAGIMRDGKVSILVSFGLRL